MCHSLQFVSGDIPTVVVAAKVLRHAASFVLVSLVLSSLAFSILAQTEQCRSALVERFLARVDEPWTQ